MNQLKYIREVTGYTQVSLATVLGVSQPTIAAWESGAGCPRADKLPEIADALNCTIDALYGREVFPTPSGEIAR